MRNEETLPTPRSLLTTLISSLPSIPITTDNVHSSTSNIGSSHRPSNPQGSTNPFRLIPPIYRPILTTLHVLYPSTLLPALDLLDRRLVTRVLLKQDTAHESTHIQAGQSSPPRMPDDENIVAGDSNQTIPAKQGNNSKPLYYLVRSAQPQSRGRHHQTASSGGQAYVVHLESWNCSCAAFAFSAFPPLSSSSSSSSLAFSSLFSSSSSSSATAAGAGYQITPAADTIGEEDAEPESEAVNVNVNVNVNMTKGDGSSGDADSRRAWEFGGLSADGRDGGADGSNVPCCKHLLACVLAERWDAVLGGYVEERLVGREEGAGLVGDL